MRYMQSYFVEKYFILSSHRHLKETMQYLVGALKRVSIDKFVTTNSVLLFALTVNTVLDDANGFEICFIRTEKGPQHSRQLV